MNADKPATPADTAATPSAQATAPAGGPGFADPAGTWNRRYETEEFLWLAGRGLLVDDFDIAEVAVAKSHRLAAERGVDVNFTVADCDHYAWPAAAYDGVAAIFVQFADPALRDRLFARMAASLKPGGTLVLQGYTPRQLAYGTGGPPIASHLYTEPMLREAFAGMEILTLREYEAEVAEGSGHRGHSALIGLVARRR